MVSRLRDVCSRLLKVNTCKNETPLSKADGQFEWLHLLCAVKLHTHTYTPTTTNMTRMRDCLRWLHVESHMKRINGEMFESKVASIKHYTQL